MKKQTHTVQWPLLCLTILSIALATGCNKDTSKSAQEPPPAAGKTTPATTPQVKAVEKKPTNHFTATDANACALFNSHESERLCLRLRVRADAAVKCEKTSSHDDERSCLRAAPRRVGLSGATDPKVCNKFNSVESEELCNDNKIPAKLAEACIQFNSHESERLCLGKGVGGTAHDAVTCDQSKARSLGSTVDNSFTDAGERAKAIAELVAMQCDTAAEQLYDVADSSLNKIPVRILAVSALGLFRSDFSAEKLYEITDSTLNDDKVRLQATIALRTNRSSKASSLLEEVKDGAFSTDAMKKAAE